MSANRKIVGLHIDDDMEFLKFSKKSFEKIGIDLLVTQKYRPFLEKVKYLSPDFCMIDLHFGGELAGFSLVRAIRKKIKQRHLPLFIISGTTDLKAVAHAMEIGASDYFFKPLDMDLFITKLNKYFSGAQIKKLQVKGYLIPEIKSKAHLSLGFSIESLDEYGLTLVSGHAISKGARLKIASSLLTEITGSFTPLFLEVVSTWVGKRENSHIAYAEYVDISEGQREAILAWIKNKLEKEGERSLSSSG